MSSNSVRHNDDLNPFIRSYNVKSLQSVLYSVVVGKTEEAYVIVRNSINYPSYNFSRNITISAKLQVWNLLPAGNVINYMHISYIIDILYV